MADFEVDYYVVLGLTRNATADDIKKGYRREALRWHPDKHQGVDKEQAEVQFKLIAEAYEVLKDPETKSRYDRFGVAGLKGASSGSASDYGSTTGFRFHSPEEIFRQFFHSAAFPPMPYGVPFQSNFSSVDMRHDPFSDPFFTQPFGMSSFAQHNSFFQQPSWFGAPPAFAAPLSYASGMQPLGPSSSTRTSINFANAPSGSSGSYSSVQTTTQIVNGHRTSTTTTTDAAGNVTRRVVTQAPGAAPVEQVFVNGAPSHGQIGGAAHGQPQVTNGSRGRGP